MRTNQLLDAIEDWQSADESAQLISAAEQSQHQIALGAQLKRVAKELAAKASRSAGSTYLTIGLRMSYVGLAAQDVPQAQALFLKASRATGAGITGLQEVLLRLLGQSRDLQSVPFWIEVLSMKDGTRSFAPARRRLAVAALAWLTVTTSDPAPEQALRDAMHHADPTVRFEAISALQVAHAAVNRIPAPALLAELLEIATTEKAFLPGFAARSLLRAFQQEVPLDNPGRIYAFEVSLGEVARTLELRAEATLEDLHAAIQRAFRWDNDHLYSFFLDGKHRDPDPRLIIGHGEDQQDPAAVSLGALGLKAGHRFVYLFDYGDCHRFAITTRATDLAAQPRCKYPRVASRTGADPAQYPSWD